MEGRSLFKPVSRAELKLKMLLGGGTGSGKTFSALRVAKGFLGSLDNVGIVDTEKSAALYSHLGENNTLNIVPFEPPFDPRRLAKIIDLAVEDNIELLIIDSVTKFWSQDSEGSALQIHQKFGGQFNDWQKTNPIWGALIQKIVQSDIHIICCARKKEDYVVELNSKGRNAPKKVGLKNEIRSGHEYEYSLALDIDMNHIATVNKDRTGIFEEICPVTLTETHGELLKAWCNGSTPPPE